MDQPDIHFTTTSDDVTIAYWSIGEGPPILITHNLGLSHAEMEWTVPSIARFYRVLGKTHRVIRFDPRSTGLSDRRRGLDSTTTGMGLDILAVIEALAIDHLTLLAASTMGPVAIEFAARHPDRVSNLVLCDTYAKVEGTVHATFMEAQRALSEVDQSFGAVWTEVTTPAEYDEIRALTEAAQEDIGETSPAVSAWNAEDHLDAVVAPTLVLASRNPKISKIDESRALVMGIGSAQLKTVEGRLLPYFGDQEAELAAIAAFLGEAPIAPSSAGKGFTTIVFTDLVASTEMLSRLGDDAGRAAVRDIEGTVTRLAADQDGEVIKNLGDGSMVAFHSTSGALSFAVGLQAAMTDSPMDLRIGMAAGEPIHEEGDLHGAVVAQAARIADHGGAGEIVVAESVHQLALGKGFAFEPVGETTLKGFDEPVALWKVSSS